MQEQQSQAKEVKPLRNKPQLLAFLQHKETMVAEIVSADTRRELKQKLADLTDWSIQAVVRGRTLPIQEKRALSFN